MFKTQTDQVNHLPVILTAKEAAELLKFSEATILRFAQQGTIPGKKVGRQWRFTQDTILNLINHGS